MKKSIIFLPLILIMIVVNLSYASSYQNIYDSMKDDYPELVNKMLEGGVTEKEILNFLDDLSDEVDKAPNLTEENFDSIMYNALKQVLFIDGEMGVAKQKHYNFALMLMTEFSSEIAQALETKTLEGDLKGLNKSVKLILLNKGNGEGITNPSGGVVLEDLEDITLKNITMDVSTLKASINTLSNGQIQINISQVNMLNNINKEINVVCEDGGTVSNNLIGILDLRLNKEGNSYKVQLPSLTETLQKVHSLSILTDIGSITIENNFISEELTNSNLNFIISQENNVFKVQLANENQEIMSFLKPITVSFPYELLADQNEAYITVVYIDDNGNEIPMGGVYNNGSIKFYTNHFSKYKVTYGLKSFTDISDLDWAKDKITALAYKGIINGRSESIFDPNTCITRAEFTSLAVRAMKLKGDKEIYQFSDINKDAWYADNVAVAYQKGIIKGRTVSTFDPNGKVTLEEVLVILARIMNTKGYKKVDYIEAGQFIADENISEWTKSEIGTALYNKLQKDIKAEDFIPNQYATRVQVASLIYEFYNKILGEK